MTISIRSGASDAALQYNGVDALTFNSAGVMRTPLSPTPCFSVVLSANQNITPSTFIKVQFNTKLFDITGAYDNVTNFRFQPTVAGYYNIFANIGSNPSVSPTRLFGYIYKNGTAYCPFNDLAASAGAFQWTNASCIMQLNGTTDFVEVFAFIGATTAYVSGNNTTYQSSFSGSLISRI